MTDSLTELIPEWMQILNVPVASVAIIEQAKVTYINGFGELNNSPMQANTVLSAQSLTKPMVAYIALQMVENNQLDLDIPLRSYLETSYVPSDSRVDTITARHTLSHSTGFPNWREENSDLTLLFAPSTDYNYSGEGYCYLQTALEAITGQGLENLFTPLLNTLSMNDSHMTTFTEKIRDHWFFANFEHLSTNAAFSLMTSAEDYAKFILAMLDEKNQAITTSMLRPEQGVANKKGFYWGNGWGIEDTSRYRYFWQWGAGYQERHLAIGSIEKQWGIVLLTDGNEGDNRGLELAHKIVQLYDPEITKWFDWLVN